MPEGDAPESAPESAPGEASIPLAAFGEAQPKAGDTLQVVAVDEENGTVSVKLAGGGKPGGIDAQAAMMDENAV